MEFWIGVVTGWSGGAIGMWYYFHKSDLLKTRDEYHILKSIRERYRDPDGPYP